MNSRIVRADLVGTVVFLAAVAIGAPFKHDRWAQVIVIVVSLALFAVGVAASLWAYARALELSRVRNVGVANLFLLTGPTAPKRVKMAMSWALTAQVVIAILGASIGVSGLEKSQLNPLAFGVLVPMFGIGMNGAWAARYGSYGPRIEPGSAPKNSKIR
ncbi:MAG TPA: hypothetical protein PLV13_11820 [Ilumatobacteraceae bacterium]|nr:hypothetical protein [Ilumatobacteraceae bacterium]